jgi:hypothetical protein
MNAQNLQKLDEIAHMNASPEGMELQIQELVDTQRSIRKDFRKIQQQVNDNFAELEGLREVAGHMHDFMHKGQLPPSAAPSQGSHPQISQVSNSQPASPGGQAKPNASTHNAGAGKPQPKAKRFGIC